MFCEKNSRFFGETYIVLEPYTIFRHFHPLCHHTHTTTYLSFSTGYFGLLGTGFGSGAFEAEARAQFDRAPVINRSQSPVLEPVI